MLAELVPLALLYDHNARVLSTLVGDFSDADWRVQDPLGHDSRWIVGHLAATRLRLVGMAGLTPLTAAWQADFARGTSPKSLPQDLDMTELLRSFQHAHGQLRSAWEGLTAETLAQPLGRTLPDGSDTTGGALRFLAWHEAYHLGQLGLMRRLVGKPGLA